MRVVRADPGFIYQIHQSFGEYLRDQKSELAKLQRNGDEWLYRFSNPCFFVFLALHGKQVVGMTLGETKPWCHKAVIEGFFVRRKFRGKIRGVRALAVALKGFLKDNSVRGVEAQVPEQNKSFVARKGFSPQGVVMEAKWIR